MAVDGRMHSYRLVVEIEMETELDPDEPTFRRDVERVVKGYPPLKVRELTTSHFLEVDVVEVNELFRRRCV